MWPSNFTFRYLGNISKNKNMWMLIAVFVCKSFKLKIIQMSISNWWTDKQNEAYPYSETLFDKDVLQQYYMLFHVITFMNFKHLEWKIWMAQSLWHFYKGLDCREKKQMYGCLVLGRETAYKWVCWNFGLLRQMFSN